MSILTVSLSDPLSRHQQTGYHLTSVLLYIVVLFPDTGTLRAYSGVPPVSGSICRSVFCSLPFGYIAHHHSSRGETFAYQKLVTRQQQVHVHICMHTHTK